MSDFAFAERPPTDIWTLPPAIPKPIAKPAAVPVGGKVALGDTELPAPAEALSVVAEPWVEPTSLEPAPVTAPPAAAPGPAVAPEPAEAKPTEIQAGAAPQIVPPELPHATSLATPGDVDAWEAPTQPDLRIGPTAPAPAQLPAPSEPPTPLEPPSPTPAPPVAEPGEVKPTQIPYEGPPIEAPGAGDVHQVSLEPNPADAVPMLAPPAPAPSDLIVAPDGAPAPAHPDAVSVKLGEPKPEDAWKGVATNEPPPDLTVTKPVDPAVVQADSLRRINQLLNASRLGIDDRAAMLNALRGGDVATMRTMFAELTGQDLDRYVSDAVSGGLQTPKSEQLNHAEADALLSGDPELAITAAVQNCGVGDKAKLTAIIASLPKTATGQPDPKLLEQLRLDWTAQHDGDDFEQHLGIADKKLLLDGEVGEAKGLEMAKASGDATSMASMLKSAKNPVEREDMLRAYVQNKGLTATSDPAEALAAFKSDVKKLASGAEADLLIALAEGNQADAAAASLQVAYNSNDLDGMNAAMASGPSPNEAGITPEEREKRLAQHEAAEEALEQAWFEKYGNKEQGAPAPDKQFEEVMSDAASMGKDPELEEQRLAASRGEGGMPLTMQVEYAVKTNDVAMVKDLMTGLDKESIETLDQVAADKCDGKTLQGVVDGAGGPDGAALKLMHEYGDKPATPMGQIAKARAMCGQARESIGSQAVSMVSGASARMDSNLATLDELEAKLQQGGELSAEEQTQLDQTVTLIEGDVQGFKADRDTAAGYAGMAAGSAASLGAGAVATAATGGMAPLLAAAAKTLIGTVASTGTKIAVNKAFQGDEYTGKKAAIDALKGAVGGAVSFGMGASGMNTAIGDLGAQLPGGPIVEKGFDAAATTAVKKPLNDAAAVLLGDKAPSASGEAAAVATSAAKAGGQAAGSEVAAELIEELKKELLP